MVHKGRARYTPHKRYCIMYRHLFRYAVCGALSKREDRNTPLLKLYSGYVCSGVCYGLLHMRDLGRKERHKATTRKGVPQGEVIKCLKHVAEYAIVLINERLN